ncbi:histidinol-phosphate transaminase [uncultured Duncaniella sp.]|uniref:histidinol-phosphate transaminase n=3 Tax=uncultured Duncaniella sp. TaxID=2768039 RepID=UPI00344C2B6F
MNPLQFVRPNILALAPYSTARDEFKGGDIKVFIDANESPFHTGFNRYPDPRHRLLKQRIAETKGVDPDMVFTGGAGSDEAIDLVYRIFCEPGVDNVIAMSPTYGVYSVAAAINNVEYREVPPAKDLLFPVEAALNAADSHSKVIWVCTPNNPTGLSVQPREIIHLAENFNGIIAVDEAYIDFSPFGSVLPFIASHPNIIVLQTFSKAWGLAGLRIGMAFSDPRISSLFANVKYPYNINAPTQREILRQLDSRDIAPQISMIKAERTRMAEALPGFPCVRRVIPSDANFLLAEVDDADRLYDFLAERGVLVRNRTRIPHCRGMLRFTVGTPAENSRVLAALADYCEETGTYPPDTVPQYAGPDDKTPLHSPRKAAVTRHTAETDIEVIIDLDGDPAASYIDTGLKFFDHMLSQLPHHGGFALDIVCRGDLDVDEHHTMEDVAIALGDAIREALGDKRGIERYGFVLPMDESRAMVLIDLGGRIDFRWDVELDREYVGDTPTEMYSHFFQSLASSLRANIYISARGENCHHIIEGVFKATARALRMAVSRERFPYNLPSSKGIL